MRKAVLVSTIAMLCLLSSSALAETLGHSVCLDANTTSFTAVIPIDGINKTIGPTIDPCPFGCNNNTGDCNPNPYSGEGYITALFLLPLLSVVILYLNNSLKEEDWTIHLMLLFISLLFAISPLFLLQIQMDTTGNSLLGIMTTLYWLLLVVFIILILYYLLKTFSLIVMRVK